MNHSDMPADWIAQAIAQNPITQIDAENIRTCPVRLSFTNLFTPSGMDDSKAPTYNTVLLFPSGVDTSLIDNAVNAKMFEKFPSFVQNGQWVGGLNWPLRDQAEKADKYDGYEAGAKFCTVKSQYKPAIVDSRQVPIVDEARVYPGCWAIAVVNAYAYSNVNKGVALGLQSLMIIADDKNLGGGGIDTATAYAGTQIAPPPNQPLMPSGNVPTAPGAPVPGAAPQPPLQQGVVPGTMPSALPPSAPAAAPVQHAQPQAGAVHPAPPMAQTTSPSSQPAPPPYSAPPQQAPQQVPGMPPQPPQQ